MTSRTSTRTGVQAVAIRPRAATIRNATAPINGADAVLVTAFHRTLREVCFTEKLSSRTYSRFAGRANSVALRQAMRDQQTASARRVINLARVFRMIGKRARSETCASICELMHEVELHVATTGTRACNDAVLISWSQELDQYRLARYGMLKEWSNKLGLSAVEEALDEALRDTHEVTAQLDNATDDIAEGAIQTAGRLHKVAKIDCQKVPVS